MAARLPGGSLDCPGGRKTSVPVAGGVGRVVGGRLPGGNDALLAPNAQYRPPGTRKGSRRGDAEDDLCS